MAFPVAVAGGIGFALAGDNQVTAGAEFGVASDTQIATQVDQVAPGGQAQIAFGFDARRAVAEVFASMKSGLCGGVGCKGAFVDEIASQGDGADILANDQTALAVVDAASS